MREYLKEAVEGKITSLLRKLKKPAPVIRKALERIKALNSRPANGFDDSSEDVVYIVPDIILTIEGGNWEISLNDRWVENYSLSDYYVYMFASTQDNDLKAYFKDKIERAKSLVSSVAQRRKTLITVTNGHSKLAGKILYVQLSFALYDHAGYSRTHRL